MQKFILFYETLQSFYLKSFSTLLQRGHHLVQAAHYSADILKNAHLKRHDDDYDLHKNRIDIPIYTFFHIFYMPTYLRLKLYGCSAP